MAKQHSECDSIAWKRKGTGCVDIDSERDRLLRARIGEGWKTMVQETAKEEGEGRRKDGDTRRMDYADTSCLGPKSIHP